MWRLLTSKCFNISLVEITNRFEQALRGRHVNMVDLIQHKRDGGGQVQIFNSLNELREYTLETRRIFPKFTLKRGALLENLLRHIFSVAK